MVKFWLQGKFWVWVYSHDSSPLTICEPYNQTKPACNDAFVISSCNFPSQDSKLVVKLCCDLDPNNVESWSPTNTSIFLKTQTTFSTKWQRYLTRLRPDLTKKCTLPKY